jgi:hypothetical protein
MVGLGKSDCRFAIDGLDRFDLQDVAVETLAIAEAVTFEAFWGRAFLMPAATCKARVQTLVRDSSPQAPSRPHLTNCKSRASDSMHTHQYIPGGPLCLAGPGWGGEGAYGALPARMPLPTLPDPVVSSLIH